MKKTLLIKDFKYIFVETGGGWTRVNNLYGITPTGELYFTKEFDKKTTELDTAVVCDFICVLDNIELGLPESKPCPAFDATFLEVVEITETLNVIYAADCIPPNNPKLYERIEEAIYKKNFTKGE